jgi:lipopolysaccharide export system protein LptA
MAEVGKSLFGNVHLERSDRAIRGRSLDYLRKQTVYASRSGGNKQVTTDRW